MKFIKTLAFASLVTFSALAFTACDNKKAEGTTDADTTTVIIEEDILDETDNASENMMMQSDTTAVEVMTEDGGN